MSYTYTCPYCKNEISRGASFCKKCGQEFEWFEFAKVPIPVQKPSNNTRNIKFNEPKK